MNHGLRSLLRNALLAIALLIPAGCASQEKGTPEGSKEIPGAVPWITVPEGFSVSVWADDVDGARSMTLSPEGTVYVGTRSAGMVYALRDDNGDGRADGKTIIASQLNRPNGVAWKDGALYVAEISRILRFDNIDARLNDPPSPVPVYSDLPTDTHHGWKFIAFGPDGKLYVPIGAPCNVCLEEDERYASITRMNADGTGFEVIAHGIRNTVGFAWHPETNALWFTDNGRDWLGDDSPGDELNLLSQPGQHFGFPFCHAMGVKDPEFGDQRDCADFTPPVQELGPHVAALGMRFYTGTMFPREYRNQVFIAEHGSWNRSEKIGYRVMLVRLDGNKALSYEPFATGWLQPGDEVRGRPVDVLVLPDGSMLVSDDHGGKIYRIQYEG